MSFSSPLGVASASVLLLAVALTACSESTVRELRPKPLATVDATATEARRPEDAGSEEASEQATEPCAWPGWRPWLGAEVPTAGLCVPEHLAPNFSKLTWIPYPEFCDGCLLLDRGAVLPDGKGIRHFAAAGSGPNFLVLGARSSSWAGSVHVAYDREGLPVAAWRRSTAVQSGGDIGLYLSNDGYMAAYTLAPEIPRGLAYVRPFSQAARLMYPGTPQVIWADPHPTDGKGYAVSRSLLAVERYRSLYLADHTTGELYSATEQTGSPGLSYFRAALTGNTAFVVQGTRERFQLWAYRDGVGRRLRGREGRSTPGVGVSDGEVVWVESSQPTGTTNDLGTSLYGRHDLYAAPLTTDPDALQPRLVRANLPIEQIPEVYVHNGHAAIRYETMLEREITILGSPPGAQLLRAWGWVIVRLRDGAAWHMVPGLEATWGESVFESLFTTETELWAAFAREGIVPPGATVLRMPYAAMPRLPDP